MYWGYRQFNLFGSSYGIFHHSLARPYDLKLHEPTANCEYLLYRWKRNGERAANAELIFMIYLYLLGAVLFIQQIVIFQIAKFMGPTWRPSRSCRPQIGTMMAPWTLLSGMLYKRKWLCTEQYHTRCVDDIVQSILILVWYYSNCYSKIHNHLAPTVM